jgi:hypothetical protein
VTTTTPLTIDPTDWLGLETVSPGLVSVPVGHPLRDWYEEQAEQSPPEEWVIAVPWSLVFAHRGSTVTACDGSNVFACDESQVYSYHGAMVYASNGSTVYVWSRGEWVALDYGATPPEGVTVQWM